MYRSQDGGNSWDCPFVVYAGPLDNRDAGIIETRKGTLLISFFTSLAWLYSLYRSEAGETAWPDGETKKE